MICKLCKFWAVGSIKVSFVGFSQCRGTHQLICNEAHTIEECGSDVGFGCLRETPEIYPRLEFGCTGLGRVFFVAPRGLSRRVVGENWSSLSSSHKIRRGSKHQIGIQLVDCGIKDNSKMYRE